MHNKKLMVAAAGAALYLATAGAAQAGNFSLGAGVDYSSGKYGDVTSTDILYVPFTGKYETDSWIFKLTVPYIEITGPGNVVRDVGVVRPTTSTTRTTERGLGDVVAAATYNLYAGGVSDPVVDLTGKVKFGTADETKGLGTGENDYAAQVDVYKGLDRFTAFGTVGYRILGSPPGVSLNNVFYGSLGGSYKIDQDLSAGLMLDLRQKASPAGAPQRELTAFVARRLDKTWKAQAYAVKGFADGSPDWGAGANMAYSF
jgi:hypothetical protein